MASAEHLTIASSRISSFVKSEKGSTTVELATGLSVIIVCVSAFLVICYWSFAKVWIERSAYEAVICLSTSAPAWDCERSLRQQIKAGLPIGTLTSLRVSRSSVAARVEIRFSIDVDIFAQKLVMKHTDSRRLPLLAEAGR